MVIGLNRVSRATQYALSLARQNVDLMLTLKTWNNGAP